MNPVNTGHIVRRARFKWMLSLIILTLISNSCALLPVRGSGNLIAEPRAVGNFKRIVFGGTAQLFISQTGDESLTIFADDNLMGHIQSQVRGETLFIEIQDPLMGEIAPSQPIRIVVSVKDLVSLDVAGRVFGYIEDLAADSLSIQTSGLSQLNIGSLHVQKLVVNISGANVVEVQGLGEAGHQEISISGTSRYAAPGLRSQSTVIEIQGSGAATLWAADFLDLRVSGDGSVNYYGHPKITQNGSGVVELINLGDAFNP